MSKSKRAQIPMDPAEYKKLQSLADREGVSVAELVRKAVWDKYFIPLEQSGRKKALTELLALTPIPVEGWASMKKEISGRHGTHLP